MLFKRFRILILGSLLFSMAATSIRGDSTASGALTAVKGFVNDHPYWSAFAGLIALKFAIESVDGLIDWMRQATPRAELQGKMLPILYSPECNFNLFGLEKVYWFDSKKYQRIHHYLVKQVGIPIECFEKPEMVSLEDLALVHTKPYLEKLEGEGAAKLTAHIIEFPVHLFFSDSSVRARILNPMKLATGGTVKAAQLAMKSDGEKCGWAINLGGGYHHCKGTGIAANATDEGHGFCAYGDIQLAIEKLWQKNPNLKVLIVDLDAHQGNGYAAYFKDKVQLYKDAASANGNAVRESRQHGKVAIFDMYNDQIYPGDIQARAYITYNVPLMSGTQDKEYLEKLRNNLPKAIAEFKPNFILYNAGTDVFEQDRLGQLRITHRGIIERDQFVFQQACNNRIPIAMVTSGGYTQQSALIIGQSIENILKNVLKIIS